MDNVPPRLAAGCGPARAHVEPAVFGAGVLETAVLTLQRFAESIADGCPAKPAILSRVIASDDAGPLELSSSLPFLALAS